MFNLGINWESTLHTERCEHFSTKLSNPSYENNKGGITCLDQD